MSTVVNAKTVHQPHGFTLNTLDLSVYFHGHVSLRDVPDCVVSSTAEWSQQLLTTPLPQPIEISVRLADEWTGFLPIVRVAPNHKLTQSEILNPVSSSPLVRAYILIIPGHVPFPPTSIQL